ncbi:helix-turn-helix domain-containing protein [Vogesella indigofera]|uniref:helix-turn-helix domain-containing protein n=1 Tax=Vogesella indigofera TaxID=45465 RepID=UPI001752017F|nr:helix-turn-helix transcriptional regulator [Vogesella indigofera]MDC7698020.1 helix-turn-helix transcriptional regulator [Vogesella indigofera]
MTDIAVLFGLKLRSRRKELKISQDDLALLSGIDRSYVGRIERGEVHVTLEKVYKLAQVLQCDARELLP